MPDEERDIPRGLRRDLGDWLGRPLPARPAPPTVRGSGSARRDLPCLLSLAAQPAAEDTPPERSIPETLTRQALYAERAAGGRVDTYALPCSSGDQLPAAGHRGEVGLEW
jgi:hypothetical protein